MERKDEHFAAPFLGERDLATELSRALLHLILLERGQMGVVEDLSARISPFG